MRLFFTFLLILFAFSIGFAKDFLYPKNFKFPKIKKISNDYQNFVPQNWKIFHKTVGDLNGDKRKDTVLILRTNYAKYRNKNEDLVDNEFDTNPQMLLILFNRKGKFELVQRSNAFIISRESPAEDEPLQKVSIKNGMLQLDFVEWQSAGSWYTSNTAYKFKYLQGVFSLIRAEKSELERNVGEVETRSYDFQAKKLKIFYTDYDGTVIKKTILKKIRIGELKTFETFSKPHTWEIEKDYFL